MKRAVKAEKALDWFDRLLWGWSAVLLALMSAVVIVSVILRYFVSVTFVWAEEAITMLFVSTTFFAAAVVVQRNENISISVITDLLPAPVKKAIAMLELLVAAAVQVVVFLSSWSWIAQVGNALTPGLRIPIRIFYLMIPISSVLIVVNLARKPAAIFRRSGKQPDGHSHPDVQGG